MQLIFFITFFLFAFMKAYGNPTFVTNDDIFSWADETQSETKIVKKIKLDYWSIQNEELKIQIFPANSKKNYKFEIKKKYPNYFLLVIGYTENSNIKIISAEKKNYQIFFNFNNCDVKNNGVDKKWLDDLSRNLKFEKEGRALFSETCNKDQRAVISKIAFETPTPFLAAVKCLPESEKEIELKIRALYSQPRQTQFKISCDRMSNSPFKAYYSEKDPAMMNYDPDVLKSEEEFLENHIHELTHASGVESETKTKEITDLIKRNYKNGPTEKCKKFEDSMITGIAAEQTKTEVATKQSLTSPTPNPVAARVIQSEFEKPFTPPTTPQAQTEYIKSTQASRNSALQWANDVVKAVGDVAIPKAHAGTLGKDNSSATNNTSAKLTSTKISSQTRNTKTNSSISSSKLPKYEDNSASQAPSQTTSSTKKNSSLQTNPETGATLSKNSGTQTQNQAQQKTSAPVLSKSPSGGGAGVISNATSSGRQIASTSNISSNVSKKDSADELIRQFQDPQLYQQVKTELNDERFQKRLQSVGIKINTLDGRTIGSQNGKIIVVDKGNKFQIYKSTSSSK